MMTHTLAAWPEKMEELIIMPRAEWLDSPVTQLGFILLGALAMVGVVKMALTAGKRLAKRAEPLTLFNQMAAELGLDWDARWLLFRIARRQKLSTPLTLLLSGGTLQHHADQFQSRLAASKAERYSYRVRAIRLHLFA